MAITGASALIVEGLASRYYVAQGLGAEPLTKLDYTTLTGGLGNQLLISQGYGIVVNIPLVSGDIVTGGLKTEHYLLQGWRNNASDTVEIVPIASTGTMTTPLVYLAGEPLLGGLVITQGVGSSRLITSGYGIADSIKLLAIPATMRMAAAAAQAVSVVTTSGGAVAGGVTGYGLTSPLAPLAAPMTANPPNLATTGGQAVSPLFATMRPSVVAVTADLGLEIAPLAAEMAPGTTIRFQLGQRLPAGPLAAPGTLTSPSVVPEVFYTATSLRIGSPMQLSATELTSVATLAPPPIASTGTLAAPLVRSDSMASGIVIGAAMTLNASFTLTAGEQLVHRVSALAATPGIPDASVTGDAGIAVAALGALLRTGNTTTTATATDTIEIDPLAGSLTPTTIQLRLGASFAGTIASPMTLAATEIERDLELVVAALAAPVRTAFSRSHTSSLTVGPLAAPMTAIGGFAGYLQTLTYAVPPLFGLISLATIDVAGIHNLTTTITPLVGTAGLPTPGIFEDIPSDYPATFPLYSVIPLF